MRLLCRSNTGDWSLIEHQPRDDHVARYEAISYRWGADTEKSSFADLTNGTGKEKIGDKKILFCAEQAREQGLGYFWIDACYINTAHEADRSHDIKSMFDWYRKARRCYAYLSGASSPFPGHDEEVSSLLWASKLQENGSSTCGWLLQELVSPQDSVKRPKFRNAVRMLSRHYLSIPMLCSPKNLRCLVMHDCCDHQVSKSLMMTFEESSIEEESVTGQDSLYTHTQGASSNGVRNSSGAAEQCMVESNVTYSTTPSDKTSVCSHSSVDDRAAGTEGSNHYNPSSSTSQSWHHDLTKDKILRANAHETCKLELHNDGPVAFDFGDPHLSANDQHYHGSDDQDLPMLGKDMSHSEEDILTNFETSALRDFMDDPGHQYWTWCKEHRNWLHKDEKTDALIWAPLDFD